MVLDRRLTRNAAFDEMFSEFIDFREPDLFMEECFNFDQTLVAFMSQVDNVCTKAFYSKTARMMSSSVAMLAFE